ncbi:MAG: SCO family protein [Acidimicrobiales bacterium]
MEHRGKGLQNLLGRREVLFAGMGSVGLLVGRPLSAAHAAALGIVDIGNWDLPDLSFAMTDADTGREVTARDFRRKVVLLYFGYTNCPDVCPMTLHNIAVALGRLGKAAERVRALFVTVDPHRDTLAVLRKYTRLFAPEVVGLRGTADQLAALASRYHIGYSVSPATASHPYEVNHSAGIYVFDARGRARLLIPSLDSSTSDVAATAGALARLLGASARQTAVRHHLS